MVKTTKTITTQMPKSKVSQVTVVTTRKARRRNRARRTYAAGRSFATETGREYLKCILGEDSAKIPDGDTHHAVKLTYEAVATVQPDPTGDLVVACLPGLPGSLRLITGSGTFQDRKGSNAGAFTDVAPCGVTIPFPDYLRPTAVATDLTANFANIQAARVVSYELEVMQVGPVLYQQGSAVTARIALQPKVEYGNTPMYCINSAAPDALYTGKAFPNIATHQPFQPITDPVGLRFVTVSTYPTSKMCNATVPCKLFGKGCGEWTPTNSVYWNDTDIATVGDTLVYTNQIQFTGNTAGAWGSQILPAGPAGKGYPIFPVIPASTDVGFIGDFWTDPECEALVWAGTNFVSTPTQPVTFQVRAKVCFELDLSFATSIYRPLVTPPVPHDPVAIETADRIMKNMPSSVDKAEGSQSWLSSVTSAVTGVADLVGDLGLPFVSSAARMGSRIAKALGLG